MMAKSHQYFLLAKFHLAGHESSLQRSIRFFLYLLITYFHVSMPPVGSAVETLLIPARSAARFLQIVFAPWPSTYEPIKSLLNAPTEAEKDLLTAAWRDRKLAELSFVGITVRSTIDRPQIAWHCCLGLANKVDRCSVVW